MTRVSGRSLCSFLTGCLLLAWTAGPVLGARPLIPEEIDALERGLVSQFDRSATYQWSESAVTASDVLLYATQAAPLGLILSNGGRPQAGRLTVLYAESLLLNGGITYLLKNLTRRTRPFVYNDHPDIPAALKMSATARRSFPSGHTSSAFTSLVFLASVYDRLYPDSGVRGWLWAGCLLTASTTGYLRYKAGYHFPTDILAGGALGAFVGWVIPRLHDIDVAHGEVGPGAPLVGVSVGF